MKMNVIAGVTMMLLLAACGKPQKQSEETPETVVATDTATFTPKIKYAQRFTITMHDGFKSIVVKNPWEGDTLASYILYPKGKKAPENVEWAKFLIPIPVDQVIATSSPHIGFMGLLEELDNVIGVANDRYIYNAYIYEKIAKGEVSQVGSLKDSNLELVLDLSPDLLMKTGYDNVRNEDDRLIEAGVPISYNVEWMETSMLARAEWIKYIGAFFNKDEEADSIFKNIEAEYLEAKKITEAIAEKPSILTGNNFKGTWYVPGSDSYLTQLINDAGGDYYYKNEKSNGSIPLSFEVVLDNQVDADFWIGPRAESLKELKMMDERYTLFKAFKDGNVYTFNKRMSKNGGNDYWESGMTRPDIILKDVIKIFHPERLPEHQLYYYKKLQ